MKKRVLLMTVLVLAIVMVAGTTAAIAQARNLKNVTSTARTAEETSEWSQSLEPMHEVINSAKKTSQDSWGSIPVYSADEILRDDYGLIKLTRDRTTEMRSSRSSINSLLRRYITEAIRIKDDGTAYFAYDTDTGYRIYVFSVEHDGEFFNQRGYTLVVSEEHSYSDFRQLRTGDPIEMVEAIDSAATVYKEFVLDFWKCTPDFISAAIEKGVPPVSLHYLTDGLLFIKYGISEAGQLVISEIQHYEDYVMPDVLGSPINYSILDIDLP